MYPIQSFISWLGGWLAGGQARYSRELERHHQHDRLLPIISSVHISIPETVQGSWNSASASSSGPFDRDVVSYSQSSTNIM
ncbi:hypothetical protein F5B20DRAFT_378628 [Whalleya microplaca]|nr:hypothetical protein F5B20DRAFT_378628 [Whalleya microplaca]